MTFPAFPVRKKKQVKRIAIGLCFIGLLSQVLTAPEPEEDIIVSPPPTLSDSNAASYRANIEDRLAAEEKRRYININSCREKELRSLPGIGKTLAKRIIEFRSENSFKRKEDLMFVPGIGSGKYNKLKMLITIK